MIDILIMHLQAPMMSFGAPVIDEIGPTERFPGLSALTGLLGNALGLSHGDAAALDRLQARLRPLCLEIPADDETLTDYQTVDLGQVFMNGTGWTTRGRREDKGSGAATRGTHIRLRDYRVETAVLVLLHLTEAEEAPTVRDLLSALRQPARPLFIGRKHCLPAGFIGVQVTTAPDLFQAAQTLLAGGLPAQPHQAGAPAPVARAWAEWPADEAGGEAFQREEARLVDRRDWRNQIHGGERLVHRGPIGAQGAA